MQIVSWNIQCGLGCDGKRDFRRIVDFLHTWSSPDVICLQEVCRYIPEYTSAGEEDQLSVLEKLLPEYAPIWGSGMHWQQPGKPTQEFGNLTLVRGDVLDYRLHALPRPPGGGEKQMPRVAVETVVAAGGDRLTILNTHLAYYNSIERMLQLDYLGQLQRWQEGNGVAPAQKGTGSWADRYRTTKTVLCGDCNFTVDGTEYRRMVEYGWHDAWQLLHPESVHSPTCGCHDDEIWPNGPHCRDYFWLSQDAAPHARGCRVDGACTYSDHQPLELTLSTREG